METGRGQWEETSWAMVRNASSSSQIHVLVLAKTPHPQSGGLGRKTPPTDLLPIPFISRSHSFS